MNECLAQAQVYHATIREILLRDWDPIGVSNFPEANDEYDSYVSQVHALLVRREPLYKLVDFLPKRNTWDSAATAAELSKLQNVLVGSPK